MKKIFITSLALLMVLSLAACGRVTDAIQEALRAPSRGQWHENVYVNEFMGFQFTLPAMWYFNTDVERVHIIGLVGEMVDDLLGEDFDLDGENQIEMQDMRASDFFTGSNIQISLTGVPATAARGLNAVEGLEEIADGLRGTALGISNVVINEDPRLLGERYWYYMTFDSFGDLKQGMFINIQGRFISTITVTSQSLEELQNLMTYFGEIDTRFVDAEGLIPLAEDRLTASLGTWDGDIYHNPTLGITFNMPEHYLADSPSDMARELGLSAGLFANDEISEDLWLAVMDRGGAVPVLSVYDTFNYSSIDLAVRKFPRGMRNFPTAEYIDLMLSLEQEEWAAFGFDVTDVEIMPGTTRIGAHNWHSGRYIIGVEDFTFMYDFFVAVVDNHVWSLTIVSDDEYELEEILAMFE